SPHRRSCQPGSASTLKWPSSIRVRTPSVSRSMLASPSLGARWPAPTTPARTDMEVLQRALPDEQAAPGAPGMQAIRIGPYELPSVAVLAPMAGVTDRPFRILCRQLGAGIAASEMLTSNTRLWGT